MPAKLISFPAASSRKSKKEPGKSGAQPLTMAAVSSFLKDTRGLIAWTAADMAKTLGANLAQAHDAIPLLAMQGYVKSAGREAGDEKWMTTIAGEQLSGSAMPRFQKEAVDRALAALQKRIQERNRDRAAAFTVTAAVAFGDFLGPASRVQAADVGIALKPRESKATRGVAQGPLAQRRARNALFSSLRSRSPMFHLLPYEEWMSLRKHRNLL